MERRGVSRIGTAFVLVFALLSTLPLTASAAPVDPAPLDTAPVNTVPANTVSDFFPEEENLSDCLGLLQRPGCGSEARGGWGQTAVFGFLVLGLGIILWRVSRGVRANRARHDATSPQ